MRIFLAITFLAAGLAACSNPDAPATTGPDTTEAFAGPLEQPQTPLTAQELVGRWSSQNGNYVEFMENGTVSVTGRDQLDMAYRVLGDSLVVGDSSAILNAETIPAANRYHIASLTNTDLVLAPATGTLGGSYTREGAAADTTGM